MTRREDAATATVGLGGVAGSAVAREHVLRSAYRQTGIKRKKPPGLVMLRNVSRLPGKRGLRAAYAGTLTTGALASVPAVTGTTGLFRRREVSKTTNEERVRAFIGTGVKGSAASLRQKATNVREPVPTRYRAGQAAAGLGAGALGAQLTHAALNRAGRLGGGRARAAATALGATLAGAGSLPATSAGVNRASHGKYRATSTGVVRAKTARKPASSKATLVQRGRPMPRGFEKALERDYPYKGLTRGQKRARVYAAGAVPGPLGPINAARQAARMAPPEQKRRAAATQYSSSQGGKYAGMAAGAYGTAALARKVPGVQRGADKFQEAKGRLVHRGVRRVSPKLGQRLAARSYRTGPGVLERNIAGAARGRGPQARAGRALARAHGPLKGVGAAAVVGGVVGSAVGGNTGSYAGYSHVLNREAARNARIKKQGPARHGTRTVSKADTAPGLTRRQTREQLKRKQRNIVASTGANVTGLGALTALGGSIAPKVPKHVRGRLARYAAGAGAASAGLGGIAGLDSQRIAQRDLAAQRKAYKLMPVGKAWVPGKLVTKPKLGTAGMSGQPGAVKRPQQDLGDPAFRRRIERRQAQLRAQMRVGKAADPIKTYGDRGPLPKKLPREERMRAYAARVEHHGGRKGQKWQRRANAADVTRNALVAGATGAGAVLLTGRSKHVANVARRTPLLRRAVGSKAAKEHAETAALATGTAIGGAELYGEYARHRRASYRSSPGGAAQSALTRMQRNTPGGS